MQGIEFEEDKSYQINTGNQGQRISTSRPGIMMRMVYKFGIDDPATANLILLGMAALFFGIAIFLYAGISSGPEQVQLTVQQQIEQNHFITGK